MDFPVIKKASYILVNTPDMVIHDGTTQTLERENNAQSEYLKNIKQSLRKFEDVVAYAPNQTYIGNMTPDELSEIARPWHDKLIENASRFGKYGEIMPQDEFYGLVKLCDAFDLVIFEKDFTEKVKEKLANHKILKTKADSIKPGVEKEVIENLVNEKGASPLSQDGELIGCIKKAHDFDKNLTAHIILENLATKASGVLSLMHLVENENIEEIEYIIECSEEAIGDMNQRGGGNLAKSIGEVVGVKNATGIDLRGFCAGPSHALVNASALVKSGIYKNVVVVAGGCTAKLGMNGKSHVEKNLPILEDCLGGFALLIGQNDGVNPILRTDVIGRHTIGHGASPQAVLEALVLSPLDKNDLRLTDVQKYSLEMQTPDITEPAGAGNVPEQNLKMIAALAVKKGQLEKKEMMNFVKQHGYPGFAPTQGHIPSGVPIIGHGRDLVLDGKLDNFMVVGKGSLFLGRMTNLFDGVSILIEKNNASKKDDSKVTINKIKIGITAFGSEHGIEEMVNAVNMASSQYEDFEIVWIGPKVDGDFEQVVVDSAEQGHAKMKELLESKYIKGCVTQHFDFPVGVSTVGKVVTPNKGKEMLVATTTGTTSTNRVNAMVMNAINGIAVAKSQGIKKPKVGILNIDGARKCEKILTELKNSGYEFDFASSVRADGGAVMRGNDILAGIDVMVCDSLTGNILIKMLSSYTALESFETTGAGYGPGIGDGYDKLINIVSRASGAPLIANSLKYCATCAKENVLAIAKAEYESAKKAGLEELLGLKQKEEINMPDKKTVTHQFAGIDILELEDACDALLKNGIYAETGMGCTGPIILVNEEDAQTCEDILKKEGYR